MPVITMSEQVCEHNKHLLRYCFVSTALHIIVLSLVLGISQPPLFVAAGQGEGGIGDGGAIQVGLADAAELGLSKRRLVGYEGADQNETVNNLRLVHQSLDDLDGEVAVSKPYLPPDARKTFLPVVPKQEQLYSRRPREALSRTSTAETASSYGSRKPNVVGGVGIGDGSNPYGTGLPGGSEYGRRVQAILSRNFTPPQIAISGVSTVIVYVKISRDGRVTSVINGRVPRQYFKTLSQNDLLNFAVERAIVATALQGLPPFPSGFLSGVNEAVAEVWFQYP